MQFPNPIITELTISDGTGNTVVQLGPGPYIIVEGTIYYWSAYQSPSGEPFVGWGLVANLVPGGTGDSFSQTLNNDGSGHLSLDTYNNNGRTWLRQFDDYVVMYTDNSSSTIDGVVFDSSDGSLKALNNVNGDPYATGAIQNWTNLTLQNGWTAKTGYYAPAYRYTIDGRIELRGVATGGVTADNTIVAIMPEIPAKLDLGDPHISGGGGANKRFFYNTDGKLYIYGCAGTVDLGFNGNRFSYK